jgi:spore coat protein CotF
MPINVPNLRDVYIKKVAHNIKLKQELKRFLLEKSFYSVKEYLDYEMQYGNGVIFISMEGSE